MTRRLALAAAFAAALVAVLASVVFAHAPLQSSDPADGATIKTPYTLTATFGEEITPNGSSLVVRIRRVRRSLPERSALTTTSR